MAGRTTLVIAHRLSTIESADVIVVLSQAHCLSAARISNCWMRVLNMRNFMPRNFRICQSQKTDKHGIRVGDQLTASGVSGFNANDSDYASRSAYPLKRGIRIVLTALLAPVVVLWLSKQAYSTLVPTG